MECDFIQKVVEFKETKGIFLKYGNIRNWGFTRLL